MTAKLTLTVKEAAMLLDLCPQTVYGMIKEGQIKALHIGRKILLSRSYIESWIEQQLEQ